MTRVYSLQHQRAAGTENVAIVQLASHAEQRHVCQGRTPCKLHVTGRFDRPEEEGSVGELLEQKTRQDGISKLRIEGPSLGGEAFAPVPSGKPLRV